MQTSNTEDDDDGPTPEKKAKVDEEDKTEKKKKEVKKKRRVKCKYAAKCFRKNKEHRKEFCHPGDSDEAEAVGESSYCPCSICQAFVRLYRVHYVTRIFSLVHYVI